MICVYRDKGFKKCSMLIWGSVMLLLVLGVGTGGMAAESPGQTPVSVDLTVKDKTISAQIVNAPLGAILAELARQANLTIYITESDAKHTVSTRFKALSMLDGIKELLGGRSYALVTEPTVSADGKPSGSRVSQIRVLSKGEAYTTITGDKNAASTSENKTLAELQRDALEASDVETRQTALETLSKYRGEVPDAEIAEIVVPALQDTAETVRIAAVNLLHRVMTWEEGAGDYLVEMAQKDASPNLRIKALRILFAAQGADAQDHMLRSLQDPDPGVRKTAQKLLERAEAMANGDEDEDETDDNQEQPEATPPAQQQ